MRTCRCCGRQTLTLWRGLSHACYERHRRDGTLHQYPANGKVTGSQRAVLAAELAKRYRADESLDRIALSIGKSATFVKNLVREAGVQLRPPGWRRSGGGSGRTGNDDTGPRINGVVLLGPQPTEFPPWLPSDRRVLGAERVAVGKLLRAWYEAGADTRLLAAATGRRYDWTWHLLREAGTAMRQRGATVVNPAVLALEKHIAARNRP